MPVIGTEGLGGLDRGMLAYNREADPRRDEPLAISTAQRMRPVVQWTQEWRKTPGDLGPLFGLPHEPDRRIGRYRGPL